MVTTVGMNSDFREVLEDLVRLDFDAIEAYEAAIERLENPLYKTKMQEFLQDHKQHITALTALCLEMGVDAPKGPGAKQIMTEGKVVIMGLFGDKAILLAMKTNEEDTNTAYSRAFNHKNLPELARPIIEKNYDDERRHRSWIMDALMGSKAA